MLRPYDIVLDLGYINKEDYFILDRHWGILYFIGSNKHIVGSVWIVGFHTEHISKGYQNQYHYTTILW